ncbi:hypothetical protein AVEN_274725-1 [Araneus ventricosus]|uniref:Uncharacterized protein n=1 Tax=Araneus ventricosus TaxID=182803 RepID=A0A4Y2VD63_ARAVE|nr:hypothetical protein AVEN_274725-1 [Araneus ventricosus]
MAGKMVLHMFLLEGEKFGDLEDRMKLFKNARIMVYFFWEQRYREPSREFYVTPRPVGKAINTVELKRDNQSLFGFLSAVQAELRDTAPGSSVIPSRNKFRQLSVSNDLIHEAFIYPKSHPCKRLSSYIKWQILDQENDPQLRTRETATRLPRNLA